MSASFLEICHTKGADPEAALEAAGYHVVRHHYGASKRLWAQLFYGDELIATHGLGIMSSRPSHVVTEHEVLCVLSMAADTHAGV